ncbi:class I SAM-dependent methyltransferase [Rhizomicrobium electricum]|uniref:Class I SAM-dependent methyltransferase n=1 Tax=Rhizomicrobium electricum TaxID=480070 RepID=A0ABN1F912_9PROT|nr:class I SAM-dependent methyltransferase [Rhizomicrobium electricum]NIJ46814.1 hypothetical protein [Rhizomicrobium electricum]
MSLAPGTLTAIKRISTSLHKAGGTSPHVLDAILRHTQGMTLNRSMETGSGATTLLLSHLSRDHTVFAMDDGNGSITNTQKNEHFRADRATFVLGPTQKTLPVHPFAGPLDFALLDGPHGYPFPDLEYYYVYPHLAPGALLVIDDIQIRSIHNLYEFLCADRMFEKVGVTLTTAFFRRTDAPVFDPLGDGWWDQGYNKKTLKRYLPGRVLGRLTTLLGR